MVVKMTGSQLFEEVAKKAGIKKLMARDFTFALVDVVVGVLKRDKEVRIPHFGKILVKDFPAKKIPAGDYANPFKRGPDGKPVIEHKEARVRPAQRKLKFYFSAQIKKPLGK
jgi:hypothetical protein